MTDPKHANEYDDRGASAVYSVLLEIGQSHELMRAPGSSNGASFCKSLSALTRQSN